MLWTRYLLNVVNGNINTAPTPNSKCLLVLSCFPSLSFHYWNAFWSLSSEIPTSSNEKNKETKRKPWTQCCKMLYIKLLPCTAIYPFHSHAYELLLVTESANWSEPPLHRAHWPPTPTLRTVADCQVGKSMCVCVWSNCTGHKNTELGSTYKPSHNLSTLRSNTPQKNSNLLCHHWACWCETLGQAVMHSTAFPCFPSPWNCTTYSGPQIPLPKMWAPCHSVC